MPAHAPYNFVPLPERVIDVREQFGDPNDPALLNVALPPHDEYLTQQKLSNGDKIKRYSGYFDVKMITESPLYVRGMLTDAEAKDQAKSKENKDKYKNKPDMFSVNGQVRIPGSSLRGMIRQIVEIITCSKLSRVSPKPKVFFRAVAADNDDPLGHAYDAVIGKLNKHVRAGYLVLDNGRWYIQPATRIDGKSIEKVKATDTHGRVRNLIPFGDPDFQVQWHPVIFKSGTVRSPEKDEEYNAFLVCSGDMLETARGTSAESPRTRYSVIGLPDDSARAIPVPNSSIQDYLDGLSTFQKEAPFTAQMGMIRNLRPVFYVRPAEGEKLVYFGHSPNFRIPHLNDKGRAVNPLDRIPDDLRLDTTYDIAEAMFGFVSSADGTRSQLPQGDIGRNYAGRLTMGDALIEPYDGDPFADEIVPPVLSGPKVTTFQHYLEQPNNEQTRKSSLLHWGTADRIRGTKLYWRQKVEKAPVESDLSKHGDSQHTRMTPIKPKVAFKSRIHFDNLTEVELGALAWAVTLGERGNSRRHQLGMGKPFGMGIVRLECKLTTINRYARYISLDLGAGLEEWDPYQLVAKYEEWISEKLGEPMRNNQRFQQFLAMLEVYEPSQELTYMLIERQTGNGSVNDYKDRPALPKPVTVAQRLRRRRQE